MHTGGIFLYNYLPLLLSRSTQLEYLQVRRTPFMLEIHAVTLPFDAGNILTNAPENRFFRHHKPCAVKPAPAQVLDELL